MIIGINICGVIIIMYDTNTINVTFYLLKVLHTLKKCGNCWIIHKIEGEHFIKVNYFLYFIPNNFFKKISGSMLDSPMLNSIIDKNFIMY